MVNYARKVDTDQRAIVNRLRELGFSVMVLSSVGRGVPDLLIGHRGRNCLVELKSDRGRLTADQERFFREWRGQVAIAHSVPEILSIFSQS